MAYLCREKIWRTAKGELVHDGDPRAWMLFAIPGMILDKAPVVLPLPESNAKARKKGEDKAIKPGENK